MRDVGAGVYEDSDAVLVKLATLSSFSDDARYAERDCGLERCSREIRWDGHHTRPRVGRLPRCRSAS